MSKLLLLEDDMGLVDGLGYALRKSGFEWELARTVKEALCCLRKGDGYDLLLLDVTLPDGTGYEVCEAVRKRGDSTPIIFLTASDEEVSVIRGWIAAATIILPNRFGWGSCVPESARCCAARGYQPEKGKI